MNHNEVTQLHRDEARRLSARRHQAHRVEEEERPTRLKVAGLTLFMLVLLATIVYGGAIIGTALHV